MANFVHGFLLDHWFFNRPSSFFNPRHLVFRLISFSFSFFIFFFFFLVSFFISLSVLLLSFFFFWLAFFFSFCFCCFLSFSRCHSLFSFFCSLSLKLFAFAWNAVLRSLVPIVVFAESAGCRLTLMQTFWPAGCSNAVLWRRVWRVFLLAGRLMASMATLTTPSKPSSRFFQL